MPEERESTIRSNEKRLQKSQMMILGVLCDKTMAGGKSLKIKNIQEVFFLSNVKSMEKCSRTNEMCKNLKTTR